MKNKLLFSLAIMACGLLSFQSCKKDRTTVFVNETKNPDKTYPVNTLSSFAKKAPARQLLSADASSSQWVTGAKGYMFYFPANALLDKNNNPVSGKVDIELIEYATKGDMLFSGVTVTSGNQLLESGGMFYLMASKNGERLHLKDNSGFSIKIPQANNGEDPMNIWIGEFNQKDPLNKVNWAKKDSVVIPPRKDSGCASCKPYFSLQFNYFDFGYCNIDREFSNFKTLISKFRIKMPDGCNSENSSALLLFKNYNCCAWCNWLPDENLIGTHYSLPLGETAKVIVYKKTGPGENDLVFALKEFTLIDNTEVNIDTMKQCTFEELSNMIKAL